ncbi:MAG: hypothetical protein ACRCUY_10630 [Thermoguttaceae bacterium]
MKKLIALTALVACVALVSFGCSEAKKEAPKTPAPAAHSHTDAPKADEAKPEAAAPAAAAETEKKAE